MIGFSYFLCILIFLLLFSPNVTSLWPTSAFLINYATTVFFRVIKAKKICMYSIIKFCLIFGSLYYLFIIWIIHLLREYHNTIAHTKKGKRKWKVQIIRIGINLALILYSCYFTFIGTHDIWIHTQNNNWIILGK
jgi:hypothetical protein